MTDLFGLDRERKIIKSGVREVFTPHQPIQTRDLFLGRQKEVQSLIEQLNTPGQHAMLFGDRGVGKSSLANVASDLVLGILAGGELIKKRCDSSDTFISVVSEVLNFVGIDVYEQSSFKEKTHGGDAGVSAPFLKGEIKSETKNGCTKEGFQSRAVSPSWVVSKVKDIAGLFLVDEVDSITSNEDKWKLAELVKLLSDESSKLKVLLVGIADTSVELTAGHPSVQRCLKETKLGRMTRHELKEIIESGQERLDLVFSAEAIRRIVSVSSGYPHFTHLLSLKAAEDAVSEDRGQINVSHVINATNTAVGDAEGTLKKAYDEAVRSANTDEYRKILVAAAQCHVEEISARELRKAYFDLWGVPISQGTLNNYFQRLVCDDGRCILRRLGKGVYRFVDPRMPSYIRIANYNDADGCED